MAGVNDRIDRQEVSAGGILTRKLDLGTRGEVDWVLLPVTGKRVVVTAVGSLGDLHPYLAIALGLKARGHNAIVATSECYRQKVLALGLGFWPLRPDSEVVGNPDVWRRYMDLRRGTERVLRDWILPVLRESYEDTLAATQGADLLVSHPITFASRLVAEKEGIKWASTMVTPVWDRAGIEQQL